MTDTYRVDDGHDGQCGGPESHQGRYRGEVKGALIGAILAIIYLGIFITISSIR
jgi:hypothetical protein